MKKLIKNLALSFIVAGILITALNFEFFWQNFKFSFLRLRDSKTGLISYTLPKDEPDMLVIENLGIKAPILYVNETSEKIFQKALQNGVVHYPGTARPGELGNVYIFGHSSDNPWAKGNYKTVFALLPRMEIGQQILVTNQDGKLFTYRVIEKRVVGTGDTGWLEPGDHQKRLLTLQTSYPIGTSLKRYIVIAEFVGE